MLNGIGELTMAHLFVGTLPRERTLGELNFVCRTQNVSDAIHEVVARIADAQCNV